MEIDVSQLLALPADQRLELAEILRHSVGCPADIERLEQPQWRLASLERVLRRADCPTEPEGR